jgi:hypothetical protein
MVKGNRYTDAGKIFKLEPKTGPVHNAHRDDIGRRANISGVPSQPCTQGQGPIKDVIVRAGQGLRQIDCNWHDGRRKGDIRHHGGGDSRNPYNQQRG